MIIELDKSKSEAGQQRPTDFLKSRAIKMKNGHLCVKSFWLMVSFSTDRCLTMVKPTWICLNIFDHQSLALEEFDGPNPEPTLHTVCAIFSATIFKTIWTPSFSTSKAKIWYVVILARQFPSFLFCPNSLVALERKKLSSWFFPFLRNRIF